MGTRSGAPPPCYETTVVLDSDSSDSEEDDEPVKRKRKKRRERARAKAGPAAAAAAGKKTRGRVKIKMAFINNKLRRYTTFSKRKTGIMKKAYELSTLTGTQVLLLVASETGHVYTFATRKLQPMITSETGKALIQTCLNSPDNDAPDSPSSPRSDPSCRQRMSATGFQETDLTYQVACPDNAKDLNKVVLSVSNMGGGNGTLLKTPGGVVFPGGFALMSGVPVLPTTHQNTLDTASPASSSGPAAASSPSGHVMYPAGHALTYAPATPSLADLNEPAPQVFLAASLPPVAAQMPASAVQLHPMSQQKGVGGANAAELQLLAPDHH